MEARWLKWAGAHGFVAVAMGAFAAHGLKARLEPGALAWVETGARYEIYHALALAALAALEGKLQPAWSRRAGLGFAWGAVVFSGCLYGMALGGWRWLGAVVPLGGLGLLWGWLCLFMGPRSTSRR